MNNKQDDKYVRYDLTGLDNLIKFVNNKSYVKVGVLRDGAAKSNPNLEGSANNAEVGRSMEFGMGAVTFKAQNSYGRKETFTFKSIPSRSWLRMPVQLMLKDLPNFISKNIIHISEDLIKTKSSNILLKLIGKRALQKIKDAFASGGFGKWAKNSLRWQAFKGNNKPLVFTGDLEKSVSYEVVDGGKKS